MRQRIEALSAELGDKEASRREARDALRDSERAISEANRTLNQLEGEGRQLRAELARIARERSALERSLAEQQGAVERMLRARYGAGGADVLRVALSGDDPAGLERRLHYVSYVSRAAATVMTGYRAGLADLERLHAAAREKAERLRAVESASRADRDKILAERRERRRVFERMAVEIRKSRREINVLRADEARLTRLVEALGRLLSQRVERAPERGAPPRAFTGARGRIKLPVQGELTGRFGAPRGAAGTESKGLFIRAAEGQPVRSVGRGRVVFADWMRGFGNMMIVDHGEHYLSIYANNESLLKQVGESVEPGESIATTGSSGGNEETGLYFEMRHLGRAFDPLRWVQTR